MIPSHIVLGRKRNHEGQHLPLNTKTDFSISAMWHAYGATQPLDVVASPEWALVRQAFAPSSSSSSPGGGGDGADRYIEFRTLSMCGFGPYLHRTAIDLSALSGCVFVLPHPDARGDSNGAGKTILTAGALLWVLTGDIDERDSLTFCPQWTQSARTGKKRYIHSASNSATATLTVQVGAHQYVVTRKLCLTAAPEVVQVTMDSKLVDGSRAKVEEFVATRIFGLTSHKQLRQWLLQNVVWMQRPMGTWLAATSVDDHRAWMSTLFDLRHIETVHTDFKTQKTLRRAECETTRAKLKSAHSRVLQLHTEIERLKVCEAQPPLEPVAGVDAAEAERLYIANQLAANQLDAALRYSSGTKECLPYTTTTTTTTTTGGGQPPVDDIVECEQKLALVSQQLVELQTELVERPRRPAAAAAASASVAAASCVTCLRPFDVVVVDATVRRQHDEDEDDDLGARLAAARLLHQQLTSDLHRSRVATLRIQLDVCRGEGKLLQTHLEKHRAYALRQTCSHTLAHFVSASTESWLREQLEAKKLELSLVELERQLRLYDQITVQQPWFSKKPTGFAVFIADHVVEHLLVKTNHWLQYVFPDQAPKISRHANDRAIHFTIQIGKHAGIPSGGQSRLIELAAFMGMKDIFQQRTSLLIMDEVIAPLDDAKKNNVYRMLQLWCSLTPGATCLLTTNSSVPADSAFGRYHLPPPSTPSTPTPTSTSPPTRY